MRNRLSHTDPLGERLAAEARLSAPCFSTNLHEQIMAAVDGASGGRSIRRGPDFSRSTRTRTLVAAAILLTLVPLAGLAVTTGLLGPANDPSPIATVPANGPVAKPAVAAEPESFFAWPLLVLESTEVPVLVAAAETEQWVLLDQESQAGRNWLTEQVPWAGPELGE